MLLFAPLGAAGVKSIIWHRQLFSRPHCLSEESIWVELLFCRSRNGQQGRLLCPKLVVVKTEPKEEEATSSYQIKSEQPKPYQTRPSNSSGTKSTKSSSRKALESCLLSSSKVEKNSLKTQKILRLTPYSRKIVRTSTFQNFPPSCAMES